VRGIARRHRDQLLGFEVAAIGLLSRIIKPLGKWVIATVGTVIVYPGWVSSKA
jgi:hypothetical protein